MLPRSLHNSEVYNIYLLQQNQPKQLDNLPNEMLTKILANIDLIELFPLRAVNTHWQAVIESTFNSKRFLYLDESYLDDYNLAIDLWLDPKKTFDGFEKKDFIFFKLKLLNDGDDDDEDSLGDYLEKEVPFTLDFCTLICQLFSTLKTLALHIDRHILNGSNFGSLLILLNHCSSTITNLSIRVNILESQLIQLLDCINSMTRLKQLNLDLSYFGQLYISQFKQKDTQLQPTLSRLERFSFYAKTSFDFDLLRYLGSTCTHLKLTLRRTLGLEPLKKLDQWVRQNPGIFHQLTHLRLTLDEVKGLEEICQQAPQLQELDVNFYWKLQVRIFYSHSSVFCGKFAATSLHNLRDGTIVRNILIL